MLNTRVETRLESGSSEYETYNNHNWKHHHSPEIYFSSSAFYRSGFNLVLKLILSIVS